MDGLKDKHRKTIMDILSSNKKVERAVLFGSRATGTFTIDSDVDLALWGKELTSKDLSRLSGKLEESSVPQEVDLLLYKSIKSEKLLKEIDKYSVEWYKKLKKNRKGWRKMKIEDMANIVGGGTPRTSISEYWKGNIPWLTPKDLSNFYGRYISSGKRSISELGLTNSSAKLLPKGTVLLTTRAPVGYLAIANNKVSINQGFRGLIPKKEVNNIFLFYILKSNVNYLKSQSTGTTFGELSGLTLKSLCFSFPLLSEQKAIAQVLSSLDDKIELNHQMNKTLESIAQAIFKSWFVDFEPVHAKRFALEAGLSKEEAEQACMAVLSGVCSPTQYVENPDKMNAKLKEKLSSMSEEKREELKNTASLFPCEFENSELGKIPEGWKITTLEHCGKIICGKTPPKKNKNYYGGSIPFIKIPDMHKVIFPLTTKDSLSKEGGATQKNKFIPPRSLCISCIATIGKVVITTDYCHTNQQINSIIPKSDICLYYLYFMMIENKDYFHILASGGTATLNMNTSTFSKIKIQKPDHKTLNKVHFILDSLFSAILKKSRENLILEKTRDTLLPKLLAGEIDLTNIKYNDNKEKTQKQEAKT